MMSGGAYVRGNMQQEMQQNVTKFGFLFDKALQAEVQRRNLIPAIVPAALPCNLLCVVDCKLVHFVFTPAGGLPNQVFIDRSSEPPLSGQQVLESSQRELGFANPSSVHFDVRILDVPEAVQLPSIEQTVRELIAECIKVATRPRAIHGYEGLQPLIDAFFQDHPDFGNNAFIAMRFRGGRQFAELFDAIRSGLAKYGLKGLRSDDKTYPPDGDLWTNVCVYMMGCRYGVCIFEEIDEREFNPYVPLEYGFMRAMNHQVLLLKDVRMPKMPSDMTGKLYRTFDTYNITITIHEQVGQWAERDLGIKAIG